MAEVKGALLGFGEIREARELVESFLVVGVEAAGKVDYAGVIDGSV